MYCAMNSDVKFMDLSLRSCHDTEQVREADRYYAALRRLTQSVRRTKLNLHTFFISGVSAANIEKVTSGLSSIDGAKPLQHERSNGLSVFACFSFLPKDEISSQVAGALTGTGAILVQANSM